MATIKKQVYDGVHYETLELEEILSEDNSPTGFFKQVNVKIDTVYGILDDQEKYEEVCNTIEEMAITAPPQYFFALQCVDNNYFKIFTTLNLIAIPNFAGSMSSGVLDELAAVGYVTDVSYVNHEIHFTVSQKLTKKELNYVFKGYLDNMIRIG